MHPFEDSADYVKSVSASRLFSPYFTPVTAGVPEKEHFHTSLEKKKKTTACAGLTKFSYSRTLRVDSSIPSPSIVVRKCLSCSNFYLCSTHHHRFRYPILPVTNFGSDLALTSVYYGHFSVKVTTQAFGAH